jgi:hypothetical protein
VKDTLATQEPVRLVGVYAVKLLPSISNGIPVLPIWSVAVAPVGHGFCGGEHIAVIVGGASVTGACTVLLVLELY